MKKIITSREEFDKWRAEQSVQYNLDPYWNHVPKKYPCLVVYFDIIEKYELKDTIAYDFIYKDDFEIK